MRTRIISITPDQAEAIRLIAKVDFVRNQCVPSCNAETLSLKLTNWATLREPHEYCRYMRHYRLHSLIHGRDALMGIAEDFKAAARHDEGVVVDISDVQF